MFLCNALPAGTSLLHSSPALLPFPPTLCPPTQYIVNAKEKMLSELLSFMNIISPMSPTPDFHIHLSKGIRNSSRTGSTRIGVIQFALDRTELFNAFEDNFNSINATGQFFYTDISVISVTFSTLSESSKNKLDYF